MKWSTYDKYNDSPNPTGYYQMIAWNEMITLFCLFTGNTIFCCLYGAIGYSPFHVVLYKTTEMDFWEYEGHKRYFPLSCNTLNIGSCFYFNIAIIYRILLVEEKLHLVQVLGPASRVGAWSMNPRDGESIGVHISWAGSLRPPAWWKLGPWIPRVGTP